MFRSIRWRLVVSYVVLTLLTVSSVGLIAILSVKRYAEQQETRSMTANAEAIARQALPLIWPRLSPKELSQLARAASFFGNARVRILDLRQNVLADSGNPGGSDDFVWAMLPGEAGDVYLEGSPEGWILGLPPDRIPVVPQEVLPLLEELPPGTSLTIVRRFYGPWGHRFSFKSASGQDILPDLEGTTAVEEARRSEHIISVPIGDVSNPVGFVEVSAGTDFGEEALATTRRAFIIAAGGAVLLAGILGLLMGRRLTAPLASLTDSTTRMSAGDLSVRAQVHGQDETGKLAAQFNHMAEQLQASFVQLAAERDSLRRFIGDASHELRTPITALRNFNELLQGSAAEDPQARAEFLAESQTQIDRLAWITKNLLDLSRLDAGVAALELSSHEVNELVREALQPFRTLAVEKGIQIEAQLPNSTIPVRCDRARLVMAVSNLLDNAVKFTPPGGIIEAGAAQDETGIQIWVKNSGPGIHPEDLPHIFERFYRGRGNPKDGSGLGLSIVQSVVQAHGGSISVETPPDGGATFIIEWPASP